METCTRTSFSISTSTSSPAATRKGVSQMLLANLGVGNPVHCCRQMDSRYVLLSDAESTILRKGPNVPGTGGLSEHEGQTCSEAVVQLLIGLAGVQLALAHFTPSPTQPSGPPSRASNIARSMYACRRHLQHHTQARQRHARVLPLICMIPEACSMLNPQAASK